MAKKSNPKNNSVHQTKKREVSFERWSNEYLEGRSKSNYSIMNTTTTPRPPGGKKAKKRGERDTDGGKDS